jgi:glucuronoarabinoxylan endo-1,4-beta-xylanase
MGTLQRTLASAFSGLLLAAGRMMSADVTVDLNTTYQTIDGFGGMQDRGWTGYNLTTAERDLLYGTGSGQIGLTIMRIRLNEDSANWSNDLVDAKDVVSRGYKVFATAWSPPTSMRTSYTFTRSGTTYTSYKLNSSYYQAYADHLNAFAKRMKAKGAALYALGFQNEPDWCDSWTCGTGTEMYNYAKNYASKLRANGNKVISAESFSFNKDYYDPILNDATTLSNLDILGTHFYGTSKTTSDATFDYTLFKQKGGSTPFWMTEVYTDGVNDATSNTWPLCLDVAYEIHRALALSNMSAYNWWYLKRSYGPLYISTNSQGGSLTGTVSKVGYIMGQYSKYVRPGAVRVSATRNVQTDVYTAVFKKSDSVVVVSVNRASSAKTVSYAISGLKSTSGAKITTSGTKSMASDGTVSVSSGAFSTTLDAQSISTLVFTGNGTTSVEPVESVAAAAGIYEIYNATGARIGQVTLAEGQSLGAQVAKLSTKSGLYYAQTRGAPAVPVFRP